MFDSKNQDIPDLPHMEPEGLEAFKKYLLNSNCYLEFGAGASTVMAATLNVKNIVSIDSSKEWITLVENTIPKSSNSSYNILHCDIGRTKKWGRPINSEGFRNYHNYVTMPWELLLSNNKKPDLILIDGRFRVLCFLYSLIMAPTNTIVLFDDYENRQNYHSIEKFCEPIKKYGRMAKFKISKNFDINELLPVILQSINNSE